MPIAAHTAYSWILTHVNSTISINYNRCCAYDSENEETLNGTKHQTILTLKLKNKSITVNANANMTKSKGYILRVI